jgi:hypothetical protein
MREGWYGDNYLVLFEDAAASLECAYGIANALPGYHLVGLLGWDDFIVEDAHGVSFTVPTVPLMGDYLTLCVLTDFPHALAPDDRFEGKIKWYVKPLIFGGDPNYGDNLSWVTQDQHIQLVNWWNKLYRHLAAGGEGMPAARP